MDEAPMDEAQMYETSMYETPVSASIRRRDRILWII
jgi:hypothetical protein